nr:uncharacterized protein LOC129267271 [Lytechinus pictus]
MPESFELHTERSVKVVRGRNASLICTFTDSAHAVYWYKHNSTGAPDDDAEVVASELLGRSDPLPGMERFRITEDYRLLISEVSIADETTYSCVVVPRTGETTRGYTDLRIIDLADSLGPIIGPCNTFVPGECTYNVLTDPPEEFVFVCELDDVRPPVNLIWIRSDDRVMEQALGPLIVEKDGLYDVKSILKVPKSGFEYHYVCQATGDAVQNASSTKLTFEEGTVLVSGWSDTSVLGVVVGLVVVIVIAVVLSLWMFIRARAKATERYRLTLNMVKTDPESSLLDKPDGEQDNLKSLQGENVENEHEEERAKFEQEEKQSLESRLKEYELNQKELERVISKQRSRIGEYEKDQIKLEQKVEELEQERERDKAKFEEQPLVELKLTPENQTLRKKMREAGFQRNQFKNDQDQTNLISSKGAHKATVILPYLGPTSHKLQRIFRAAKIEVGHRSSHKLHAALYTHKDVKPSASRPGVYRIACSCGKVYIGETGRNLTTRLKEHQNSYNKWECEKSAIAKHANQLQHKILWEDAKLLTSIKHWHTRRVREAIEITQHDTVPQDSGLLINNIWNPLLNKTTNQ